MPQALASLAGTAFYSNPTTYQHRAPSSAAYVQTMQGGYILDYGTLTPDEMVTLTWALVPYSFYAQLDTTRRLGTNVAYVDPWGTSRTVHVMDLLYDKLIAGGDDAVNNVTLTLQVVSKP